MVLAPLGPRRPGGCAAEARVKGPVAASSRISNALLATPPFPWLRAPMPQIRCGAQGSGTLIAQIGAAHRLLVLQVRALAFDRDAADLEYVSARRKVESDARVLLDQQHRDMVAFIDRADDVEDGAHDERGQSQRRLIEQQQLRAHEESPCEREHLLLTA